MVEAAKVEIELAEGEQVVTVGDVEWFVKASLVPFDDDDCEPTGVGEIVLLTPSEQIENVRQILVTLHKASPSEYLIQAIYGLETSNQYVRAWQRENA